MHTITRLNLGCLVVVALAGCASLSARQCRTGDWAGIGRADGERGVEASEIERHGEACARHGVTPDAAAWKAGYDKGLAKFCTLRGAYVAGRAGEADRGACPAPPDGFRAAFLHGTEVGRALRELKELRRRAHELQLAAMSGEYAPEDQTALRFRADEAGRRARAAEREIERLDRKYAREYGAPELAWEDLY